MKKQRASICLLPFICSSCFHPPYNDFQKDPRPTERVARTAAIGAGFGVVAGLVVGNAAVGAVVGGAMGSAVGLYYGGKRALIKRLYDEEIQFFEYGDTLMLQVPTDRYYQFDSARLNDRCYNGLLDIVKLLQYYPCTPIYVAAFTDNVGSWKYKRRLSQAKAETMLTFLWANHIPAQRLQSEGYGDKHAIGDNHFIHGSAYNRRIEIQWTSAPSACSPTGKTAAMK